MAVVESELMVSGVSVGDRSLATALQHGLAKVENTMVEELSRGPDFMTDSALHLVKAGGKRFRPLFTLLAAQLGPCPNDPMIPLAAAALELVHIASLYHDDVMDEASLRRGTPSANALWGNSSAIWVGDYLFARANSIGAILGPEAVRIMAETFDVLVAGQFRETVGVKHGGDPIEHYLQVIWEKTGVLIANAGTFGGMFSRAESDQVERLRRFGDAVGIAFQIADDIIDISSTFELSGKTPGTDLREGVNTLPVLYALQEHGSDADRLRKLLVAPLKNDRDVTEAISILVHSQGMVRAKRRLDKYVDKAISELKNLPDGPANSALENLVHHTVERAY